MPPSQCGFVLAEGSFNGAYDGFPDGCSNWYRRVTRCRVPAFGIRSNNEFVYDLNYEGPPRQLVHQPTAE